MSKQTFEDIQVWKHAHQLVIETYKECSSWPSIEKHGVLNQLRRALVSIAANIAEGYGRHSNKEFCQFLYISLGSSEEVHYYLILARDLKYMSDHKFQILSEQLIEIKKELIAFIHYLEKKS